MPKCQTGCRLCFVTLLAAYVVAESEEAAQQGSCVELLGNNEVYLQEVSTAKDVLRQHRLRNRQYAFDAAFDGAGTQEQVRGSLQREGVRI